MKKLILLHAIISLLLISSCKKDDKKPPTKSDDLTSGTWSITAVTSDEDGDGTYEMNDFADFDDCFKDNIYTFHPDGKWEINEGATKCGDADPQTTIALWQLTANDTQLILATDTYIIQEFTSAKLVLKLPLENNASSLITLTKR
jgi:hypothetical protein